MKLDQLRRIIREEVRAAVKEELQDVITEAVKIASAVPKMTPAPKPGTSSWSASKPTNLKYNDGSINSMLEMTKSSMTGEDFNNVMNTGGSMVKKPNFASGMAQSMGMTENKGPAPGIDISNLDFVSKAKAIYDKSLEKGSKL